MKHQNGNVFFIPIKWSNSLMSVESIHPVSPGSFFDSNDIIASFQIISEFYNGKESIFGKSILRMNLEEVKNLINALKEIIGEKVE